MLAATSRISCSSGSFAGLDPPAPKRVAAPPQACRARPLHGSKRLSYGSEETHEKPARRHHLSSPGDAQTDGESPQSRTPHHKRARARSMADVLCDAPRSGLHTHTGRGPRHRTRPGRVPPRRLHHPRPTRCLLGPSRSPGQRKKLSTAHQGTTKNVSAPRFVSSPRTRAPGTSSLSRTRSSDGSGVYLRSAVRPRPHLLQLRRDAEEHVLAAVRRRELDADRQPVGVPV